MKKLFKSLLGLLVLTTALAPQADAQLVTYQFTGTLIGGTAGIGNTIAGSVTLDVGALPDFVSDIEDGGGQFGVWYNGGFSINGVTDTGFEAGTSFGGNTEFINNDIPSVPYQYNSIGNNLKGTHPRGINLSSYSYSSGDGFTSVPNPWNPLADQEPRIDVYDYDYSTETFEYGTFSIDIFTLQPSTIIIDGRDTGIDDFEYQGKLVSTYLAEFAANATNQGGYVSSVSKLANDLRKAGLLTKEQEKVMKSSASQSNIGKK